MSELKEIGGYIVSADPFVQHDNTLSGNGTSTSPLGVVNGYNETVLYSANSVTNNTVGQVFPMSEPVTNFERIRIICDNMEYQNRPCMQEFPVLNSSCRFNTPMLNDNGGTSININIPYATYNINSSGDLVCAARGLFYGDWNTPYHTNGDWRGYCLLKVVGINRKPGV